MRLPTRCLPLALAICLLVVPGSLHGVMTPSAQAAVAQQPLIPPGAGAPVNPPSDAWNALLTQAMVQTRVPAAFAAEQGAVVEPTADGRTFTVFWSPVADEQQVTRPVIVTLHGSDGYAFNEIAIWHRFAAARGYAILAVQWWLGKGDGLDDYLRPREAYAALASVLRARGVQPGTVLLHGFSRGSANIYGVAALDRVEGDRYARVVVANAGGAAPNYPINRDISNGLLGPMPLAETAWVTYCGGRDPNPERDGCPMMRRSADWVAKLGGEIALQIEDPNSGHGGFHLTPAHVETALDQFAARLGSE